MRQAKICPKCGSADVTVPKRGIDLLNLEMVCNECGFKGVFPHVDIDKVEEFRKRLKDDKQDS